MKIPCVTNKNTTKGPKRLCGASKSAMEMVDAKTETIKRLVAEIEDLNNLHFSEAYERLFLEELHTHSEMLIAQGFLDSKRPVQANFRIIPLYKKRMSAERRRWRTEFFKESLAGLMKKRNKEYLRQIKK